MPRTDHPGRRHLNADHADDLVILAARLFGTPRHELAAVTVEWIDTLGVELGIIDEEGASAVRCRSGSP